MNVQEVTLNVPDVVANVPEVVLNVPEVVLNEPEDVANVPEIVSFLLYKNAPLDCYLWFVFIIHPLLHSLPPAYNLVWATTAVY